MSCQRCFRPEVHCACEGGPYELRPVLQNEPPFEPATCVKCQRPFVLIVPSCIAATCAWCNHNSHLTARLNKAFQDANVRDEDREAVRAFLAPIFAKESRANSKDDHPGRSPTQDHCIRVGLLTYEIGRFMGVDERACLFAGLLHDIGKALVLMSTLTKTDSWTEADSKEMEAHVLDGFRMLRGRFDFSAQIIAWHHQFQHNSYPSELPIPLHGYSKGTEVTIAMYGRILALADSYDALHRVNYQEGKVRARTDEEIKKLMLERNKDQTALLGRLYAAKVLV